MPEGSLQNMSVSEQQLAQQIDPGAASAQGTPDNAPVPAQDAGQGGNADGAAPQGQTQGGNADGTVPQGQVLGDDPAAKSGPLSGGPVSGGAVSGGPVGGDHAGPLGGPASGHVSGVIGGGGVGTAPISGAAADGGGFGGAMSGMSGTLGGSAAASGGPASTTFSGPGAAATGGTIGGGGLGNAPISGAAAVGGEMVALAGSLGGVSGSLGGISQGTGVFGSADIGRGGQGTIGGGGLGSSPVSAASLGPLPVSGAGGELGGGLSNFAPSSGTFEGAAGTTGGNGTPSAFSAPLGGGTQGGPSSGGTQSGSLGGNGGSPGPAPGPTVGGPTGYTGAPGPGGADSSGGAGGLSAPGGSGPNVSTTAQLGSGVYSFYNSGVTTQQENNSGLQTGPTPTVQSNQQDSGPVYHWTLVVDDGAPVLAGHLDNVNEGTGAHSVHLWADNFGDDEATLVVGAAADIIGDTYRVKAGDGGDTVKVTLDAAGHAISESTVIIGAGLGPDHLHLALDAGGNIATNQITLQGAGADQNMTLVADAAGHEISANTVSIAATQADDTIAATLSAQTIHSNSVHAHLGQSASFTAKLSAAGANATIDHNTLTIQNALDDIISVHLVAEAVASTGTAKITNNTLSFGVDGGTLDVVLDADQPPSGQVKVSNNTLTVEDAGGGTVHLSLMATGAASVAGSIDANHITIGMDGGHAGVVLSETKGAAEADGNTVGVTGAGTAAVHVEVHATGVHLGGQATGDHLSFSLAGGTAAASIIAQATSGSASVVSDYVTVNNAAVASVLLSAHAAGSGFGAKVSNDLVQIGQATDADVTLQAVAARGSASVTNNVVLVNDGSLDPATVLLHAHASGSLRGAKIDGNATVSVGLSGGFAGISLKATATHGAAEIENNHSIIIDNAAAGTASVLLYAHAAGSSNTAVISKDTISLWLDGGLASVTVQATAGNSNGKVNSVHLTLDDLAVGTVDVLLQGQGHSGNGYVSNDSVVLNMAGGAANVILDATANTRSANVIGNHATANDSLGGPVFIEMHASGHAGAHASANNLTVQAGAAATVRLTATAGSGGAGNAQVADNAVALTEHAAASVVLMLNAYAEGAGNYARVDNNTALNLGMDGGNVAMTLLASATGGAASVYNNSATLANAGTADVLIKAVGLQAKVTDIGKLSVVADGEAVISLVAIADNGLAKVYGNHVTLTENGAGPVSVDFTANAALGSKASLCADLVNLDIDHAGDDAFVTLWAEGKNAAYANNDQLTVDGARSEQVLVKATAKGNVQVDGDQVSVTGLAADGSVTLLASVTGNAGSALVTGDSVVVSELSVGHTVHVNLTAHALGSNRSADVSSDRKVSVHLDDDLGLITLKATAPAGNATVYYDNVTVTDAAGGTVSVNLTAAAGTGKIADISRDTIAATLPTNGAASITLKAGSSLVGTAGAVGGSTSSRGDHVTVHAGANHLAHVALDLTATASAKAVVGYDSLYVLPTGAGAGADGAIHLKAKGVSGAATLTHDLVSVQLTGIPGAITLQATAGNGVAQINASNLQLENLGTGSANVLLSANGAQNGSGSVYNDTVNLDIDHTGDDAFVTLWAKGKNGAFANNNHVTVDGARSGQVLVKATAKGDVQVDGDQVTLTGLAADGSVTLLASVTGNAGSAQVTGGSVVVSELSVGHTVHVNLTANALGSNKTAKVNSDSTISVHLNDDLGLITLKASAPTGNAKVDYDKVTAVDAGGGTVSVHLTAAAGAGKTATVSCDTVSVTLPTDGKADITLKAGSALVGHAKDYYDKATVYAGSGHDATVSLHLSATGTAQADLTGNSLSLLQTDGAAADNAIIDMKALATKGNVVAQYNDVSVYASGNADILAVSLTGTARSDVRIYDNTIHATLGAAADMTVKMRAHQTGAGQNYAELNTNNVFAKMGAGADTLTVDMSATGGSFQVTAAQSNARAQMHYNRVTADLHAGATADIHMTLIAKSGNGLAEMSNNTVYAYQDGGAAIMDGSIVLHATSGATAKQGGNKVSIHATGTVTHTGATVGADVHVSLQAHGGAVALVTDNRFTADVGAYANVAMSMLASTAGKNPVAIMDSNDAVVTCGVYGDVGIVMKAIGAGLSGTTDTDSTHMPNLNENNVRVTGAGHDDINVLMALSADYGVAFRGTRTNASKVEDRFITGHHASTVVNLEDNVINILANGGYNTIHATMEFHDIGHDDSGTIGTEYLFANLIDATIHGAFNTVSANIKGTTSHVAAAAVIVAANDVSVVGGGDGIIDINLVAKGKNDAEVGYQAAMNNGVPAWMDSYNTGSPAGTFTNSSFNPTMAYLAKYYTQGHQNLGYTHTDNSGGRVELGDFNYHVGKHYNLTYSNNKGGFVADYGHGHFSCTDVRVVEKIVADADGKLVKVGNHHVVGGEVSSNNRYVPAQGGHGSYTSALWVDRGNWVSVHGGTGADHVNVSLHASANAAEGNASVMANHLTIDGGGAAPTGEGSPHDVLSVSFAATGAHDAYVGYVKRKGSSVTSATGNTISLKEESGNASITFHLSALAGHEAAVDADRISVNLSGSGTRHVTADLVAHATSASGKAKVSFDNIQFRTDNYEAVGSNTVQIDLLAKAAAGHTAAVALNEITLMQSHGVLAASVTLQASTAGGVQTALVSDNLINLHGTSTTSGSYHGGDSVQVHATFVLEAEGISAGVIDNTILADMGENSVGGDACSVLLKATGTTAKVSENQVTVYGGYNTTNHLTVGLSAKDAEHNTVLLWGEHVNDTLQATFSNAGNKAIDNQITLRGGAADIVMHAKFDALGTLATGSKNTVHLTATGAFDSVIVELDGSIGAIESLMAHVDLDVVYKSDNSYRVDIATAAFGAGVVTEVNAHHTLNVNDTYFRYAKTSGGKYDLYYCSNHSATGGASDKKVIAQFDHDVHLASVTDAAGTLHFHNGALASAGQWTLLAGDNPVTHYDKIAGTHTVGSSNVDVTAGDYAGDHLTLNVFHSSVKGKTVNVHDGNGGDTVVLRVEGHGTASGSGVSANHVDVEAGTGRDSIAVDVAQTHTVHVGVVSRNEVTIHGHGNSQYLSGDIYAARGATVTPVKDNSLEIDGDFFHDTVKALLSGDVVSENTVRASIGTAAIGSVTVGGETVDANHVILSLDHAYNSADAKIWAHRSHTVHVSDNTVQIGGTGTGDCSVEMNATGAHGNGAAVMASIVGNLDNIAQANAGEARIDLYAKATGVTGASHGELISGNSLGIEAGDGSVHAGIYVDGCGLGDAVITKNTAVMILGSGDGTALVDFEGEYLVTQGKHTDVLMRNNVILVDDSAYGASHHLSVGMSASASAAGTHAALRTNDVRVLAGTCDTISLNLTAQDLKAGGSAKVDHNTVGVSATSNAVGYDSVHVNIDAHGKATALVTHDVLTIHLGDNAGGVLSYNNNSDTYTANVVAALKATAATAKVDYDTVAFHEGWHSDGSLALTLKAAGSSVASVNYDRVVVSATKATGNLAVALTASVKNGGAAHLSHDTLMIGGGACGTDGHSFNLDLLAEGANNGASIAANASVKSDTVMVDNVGYYDSISLHLTADNAHTAQVSNDRLWISTGKLDVVLRASGSASGDVKHNSVVFTGADLGSVDLIAAHTKAGGGHHAYVKSNDVRALAKDGHVTVALEAGAGGGVTGNAVFASGGTGASNRISVNLTGHTLDTNTVIMRGNFASHDTLALNATFTRAHHDLFMAYESHAGAKITADLHIGAGAAGTGNAVKIFGHSGDTVHVDLNGAIADIANAGLNIEAPYISGEKISLVFASADFGTKAAAISAQPNHYFRYGHTANDHSYALYYDTQGSAAATVQLHETTVLDFGDDLNLSNIRWWGGSLIVSNGGAEAEGSTSQWTWTTGGALHHLAAATNVTKANGAFGNITLQAGNHAGDHLNFGVADQSATEGDVKNHSILVEDGGGGDTVSLQLGHSLLSHTVSKNHVTIEGGIGADSVSVHLTAHKLLTNTVHLTAGGMGETVSLYAAGVHDTGNVIDFNDRYRGTSVNMTVFAEYGEGSTRGTMTGNLVHGTVGSHATATIFLEGGHVLDNTISLTALRTGDTLYQEICGNGIVTKISGNHINDTVGSDDVVTAIFGAASIQAHDTISLHGTAAYDTLHATFAHENLEVATYNKINETIGLFGHASATMQAWHATHDLITLDAVGNNASLVAHVTGTSVLLDTVNLTLASHDNASLIMYGPHLVSNDVDIIGRSYDTVHATIGQSGQQMSANTIDVTIGGYGVARVLITDGSVGVGAAGHGNTVHMSGTGAGDSLWFGVNSGLADFQNNHVSLTVGARGVVTVDLAPNHSQTNHGCFVDDNTVSIVGHGSHETLSLKMGNTNVTGNLVHALMGSRADLSAQLSACRLSHNQVSLTGGDHGDTISLNVTASQAMKSNSILLHGGMGDDTIAFNLNAQNITQASKGSHNSILFSGGGGADHFTLDLQGSIHSIENALGTQNVIRASVGATAAAQFTVKMTGGAFGTANKWNSIAAEVASHALTSDHYFRVTTTGSGKHDLVYYSQGSAAAGKTHASVVAKVDTNIDLRSLSVSTGTHHSVVVQGTAHHAAAA